MLVSARAWALRLAEAQPSVIAIGYFGSYARGEAGFGSDLDVLVVRRDGTSEPDLLGADVAALPVPADILHYTEGQLRAVVEQQGRMATVIDHETRWWVGESLTSRACKEAAEGA